MQAPCPTRDQLLAFHLGKLPSDAIEGVSTHVEACAKCEALLEQMEATDDALLSGLRRPAPASPALVAETNELELVLDEAWPGLPGYHFIGQLGRGGMGVVFEARQEDLNRVVAVKRLATGSGRLHARSLAEAETLARLRHPNIVQIHEILKHDSGLFLILELVEGGSLARVLRGRPTPPRDAAAFILDAARAIHHAHSLGIVHRDLKPANILLAVRAELKIEPAAGPGEAPRLSAYLPKVADFGIAKRLSSDASETREGEILGTPSYMAPEQAGGKSHLVGPATDVYSLGVILYEMLTGRVPLQGPTTLDTLLMVRTEEPVPPRQLQPGIPRDLETVCLKCLQKDPARRYTTAEQLVADLQRFRDGKPVLARRTPAWERAWKWARREPRIAGLSAALVLAIAVGFTLVTLKWRAERLARDEAEQNERTAARLSASMALDRGIALAETGKLHQGLLWMARSLELAVQAGDADLEHAIRYNLAVWPTFLSKSGSEFLHDGWVWSVAYSPDASRILTCGSDRLARLWDAKTGQLIGEPLRHDEPVWAIAFSPDGQRVLTGCGTQSGANGRVKVWDAATTRLLHESPALPDAVFFVQFAPDGERFLSVSPRRVRLWTTAGARPIGEPLTHAGPALKAPLDRISLGARFSPDGETVATCGADGTVRFWDARTGNPRGSPLAATGPVLSLAFSPDGKSLLTGGFDRVAHLWSLETGRPLGLPMYHSGRVRSVKFSPDGELMATVAMEEDAAPEPDYFHVTGGEVRLWQARTGHRLGPPLRHPNPVWSAAFSADNRFLATGSEDGSLRFFLTATGAQTGDPLGHDGTVRDVAVRPDGLEVLAASAGGHDHASARTWYTPAGQGRGKPLLLGVELLGLAFTPDGHKLLATAKDDSVATATGGRVDAAKFGSVNVIDVDRQLVVSRVTVPTHPTSVAVRPDGQGYLVANVSGLHQYRDLADNRVCHSLTTGTEINALAFSPDGRTYLAGDRNGWLWLREADTGREIGEPFRATSPFWAARFTADGKHVLTGTDAGAQLWDLDTHALVRNTAGKGQVLGISLFPDGTRALLIFDGFAREWTFTAGEAVQPSLIHPEGGIDRISLSPDGTMALVTGNDGASGLWHLATGKQLGPSLATNARPVIFSHDGRRMAVGDKDGRIVLWEVARPAKGTPARIRLWYETLTRLELDPASTVRKLSAEEVRDRASELDGLGGPPVK